MQPKEEHLKFVSCYRDPQPQVCENYLYLFNLKQNIYKIFVFKHALHSQ